MKVVLINQKNYYIKRNRKKFKSKRFKKPKKIKRSSKNIIGGPITLELFKIRYKGIQKIFYY